MPMYSSEMASDPAQINRLLEQIDEAQDVHDWTMVKKLTEEIGQQGCIWQT